MSRNAYPVAGYRTSAARSYAPAPDFQKAFRVPTAANDNLRLLRAANDNMPRIGKSVARTSLRALRVGRVVPALGYALTAYEVYRYFHDAAYPEQVVLPANRIYANGYVKSIDCGWPAQCWSVPGGLTCANSWKVTSGPEPKTLNIYKTSSGQLGAGSPISFYEWRPRNSTQFELRLSQRYVKAPGTGPMYWYAEPQTLSRYGRLPQPVGSFIPSIDAMMLPIGQPVPVPRAVPYRLLPLRQPNPFRVEQTEFGNAVDLQPEPQAEKPIVLAPGSATSPHQEHRAGRPPKRMKERKMKLYSVSGVSPVLSRVIGAVGETADFVNALWWALPRSARTRGKPTIQQKALDVYRGFDQMDLERAFVNLATNELQDRAIGGFNKRVQRAYRAAGKAGFHDRPFGITIGPAT